jgi:hypothetical protein
MTPACTATLRGELNLPSPLPCEPTARMSSPVAAEWIAIRSLPVSATYAAPSSTQMPYGHSSRPASLPFLPY